MKWEWFGHINQLHGTNSCLKGDIYSDDKKIPYFIGSRKFITVFIKSHQSTSIAHYETDGYSPHTASLSLSLA
jgi:hypothetical protein